ncbi:4a-hydroxytetrahydrobiopterin dehydratase [Ottowia sp.]|uniref:4a-hydroxytetrahydrobiopterin dehydratase n=1 Tax=Ottowia sp. TaxID=1898956 RepID=UPI0039E66E6E
MAPAPVPPAQAAPESGAIDAPPPGWTQVVRGGVPALEKRWRLPDFAQAMALAQAVAELAERLNHHPDLHVGWGQLAVVWTTHDAGGVTALDVRAARATDELAAAADAQPRTP